MDDVVCIKLAVRDDDLDGPFRPVNHHKGWSEEEVEELFANIDKHEAADAQRIAALGDEIDRIKEVLAIPKAAPIEKPEQDASETPTTLAKAVVPTPSLGAALGSFPVSDIAALLSVVDPLAELDSLMAELRIHGDYDRIRDRYCQLSIRLNTEGLLAPAFRTPPKPGARRNDPVFKQIHRDQLVIDCHWLFSQGLMVKPRDIEFCPMFNTSGPFPFDLAWKFANKVWKKEHRAEEALSLTTFQQCQLATLRGPTVAERFNLALSGVKTPAGRKPAKVALVKKGLGEWCERNVRIFHLYEDYKSLWLASELLDSNASVSQIGKLHGLICGRLPLNDTTIQGKIKTMKKQLEGYF